MRHFKPLVGFAFYLLLVQVSCLFDGGGGSGPRRGGRLDTNLVSFVSVAVTGSTVDPAASGSTWGASTSSQFRYGQAMKAAVSVHGDGSLSIGWTSARDSTLILTRLTAGGVRIGSDVVLERGVRSGLFCGLTALGDTGYAYGFVPANNRAMFVFKITDAAGATRFIDTLIGDGQLNTPGATSKQDPLAASSSRIRYNSASDKIAVYFGHLQMWDDSIKHQGGYLKFIDSRGLSVGTNNRGDNGWLYSHNFDQRLRTDGAGFVLLGHGDAYPRALPLRTIDGAGRSDDVEVFAFSGAVGDNTTDAQLGDVVTLPGGGYGMTFASSEGRGARDAAYVRVGADLSKGAPVWLTAYSGNTFAYNVKSAAYGANVLVAWEKVVSTARRDSAEALFAVVDSAGKVLLGPDRMPGVRINAGDDFFNYANGDVGWVVGAAGAMKIFRFRI